MIPLEISRIPPTVCAGHSLSIVCRRNWGSRISPISLGKGSKLGLCLRESFQSSPQKPKLETFWPFPKLIFPHHGDRTSPGRTEFSLCLKEVRNGGWVMRGELVHSVRPNLPILAADVPWQLVLFQEIKSSIRQILSTQGVFFTRRSMCCHNKIM